MTTIKLYDHPFAAVAPRVFEVTSLAEWLLAHYGAAPQVNVQIFAGEPSAENEISHDAAAILANAAGEYLILESPGADPFTWAIAIAAVFAVAAYVLMPKPVMPGNINRTQQSPNNALGSRENKVRLLERVEDIYGTVKSIPSLMMPTYNKYIDNKKYEYGYYCIGRGYYDVAVLSDGDTLIDAIDGASASVYAPFTSPNSGHAPQAQIGAAIIDDVLAVRRAVEIDGVTLKASNQSGIPDSQRYDFYATGRIVQKTKSPNFNSIFSVGDQAKIVAVRIGVDPFSYSGTFGVVEVGDGYILLDTGFEEDSLNIGGSIENVSPIVEDGWVTLPDKQRTQVWCNVVAQNGLFKDNGGKSPCTVDFEIKIERLSAALEPTGQVETVAGALTGADSDEHADTVEHSTAWTGPARVKITRTSLHDFSFEGTVQDEIKWADLYSVTPVTATEFGNKTTIHTITQATARATAVKTRQLNCLASRRLPTYNGSTFSGAFDSTGRLVSGTLAATSKLVDIIAAVSVDPKIGNRDLATEVDMAQIWSVQQALDAWNPECGQFNFTFDTDNTSFEETIITIANAGFCIAYRQNGKLRLSLDRAQAASTALFTHRNKKPRAETITRKFASDADYDGVEFVYVDPDSAQSETITLPLDGSYTKLKKFEIAGIRSFEQAWLRANREYFKIRGQRINIETTTTMDARALLPNARVDIVDNTRFKSYDGEVIGQAGLVLTLSQEVKFVAGLPHSIVLMRRDGSLQSIPVTAGAEANKVVLQSLPSEAITTSYGPAGIRTIFSFAADSARGSMAYLVQEIDLSDGQYVTVRAVNYSADYYQMDYAAIPARETIIN